MKLSKHSKLRMKERTNLNHKERVKLFKSALRYGGNWKNSKNKELVKYLESKEGKAQVKLYKGYVFIHSKISKQLYTMYELPDKYKETNEKEKNNE